MNDSKSDSELDVDLEVESRVDMKNDEESNKTNSRIRSGIENSPPRSISILLYNVWNLPSCCTDGHSRSRAKHIAEFLGKYDVIILNEAFINKDVLLSKVKESHEYVRGLGRKWYTLFDSGVMIVSRFPIIKHDTEHCKMRRGFDFWAAKGIVFVRLKVDDHKTIDVYGTHLQAGAKESHQAARASQSDQVARFILKNSPLVENENKNKSPVILTGDLNMGPVLSPSFSHFSGHYVDKKDAMARHQSYVHLRDTAGLTDVFGRYLKEDICRFLVRNLTRPPKLTYVDWATSSLSDTDALLCEIEV